MTLFIIFSRGKWKYIFPLVLLQALSDGRRNPLIGTELKNKPKKKRTEQISVTSGQQQRLPPLSTWVQMTERKDSDVITSQLFISEPFSQFIYHHTTPTALLALSASSTLLNALCVTWELRTHVSFNLISYLSKHCCRPGCLYLQSSTPSCCLAENPAVLLHTPLLQ